LIIASKRDTSQFYLEPGERRKLVDDSTFPTTNAVINKIGCIPEGCGLRVENFPACRQAGVLCLLAVELSTSSSASLEIFNLF